MAKERSLIAKGKWKQLTEDDRSFGKRLLFSLFPSLLLSFTIFGYGSYEMYQGNRRFLWFSYGTILPWLLACGAAVALISVLFCMIFRGRLFNMVVSLVYSIGIGLFMQGTFLNKDLGTLTGETVEWQNETSLAFWNTLIWILIIIIPLIIGYFSRDTWKNIVTVTSIVLVLLQIGLTVVVGISPTESSQVDSRGRYLVNEGTLTVSHENNTVVFLLDMFDQNYVSEFLDKYPDVFDDMDGFTYYGNNVGTNSRTVPSITQYLTGVSWEYDVPYDDYIETAFSEGTFLQKLKEAGYDVRLCTDTACLPAHNVDYIDNYLVDDNTLSYAVTSEKGLVEKWLSFVAYRYMPQLAKPYFFLYTTDFDDYRGDIQMEGSDADLQDFQYDEGYSYIQENGLSLNDASGSFRFFHMPGAHYPYQYDEQLNKLSEGESDVYRQLYGQFNFIKEYISRLKKLGVYDETSIWIMADHGDVPSGTLDKAVDPFLMVKPQNSTEAYHSSTAPAWAMDFRKTVLLECGLDASDEQGEDLRKIGETDVRERFFNFTQIIDGREHTLVQFSVGEDANDFSEWKIVKETPILYSYFNTFVDNDDG